MLVPTTPPVWTPSLSSGRRFLTLWRWAWIIRWNALCGYNTFFIFFGVWMPLSISTTLNQTNHLNYEYLILYLHISILFCLLLFHLHRKGTCWCFSTWPTRALRVETSIVMPGLCATSSSRATTSCCPSPLPRTWGSMVSQNSPHALKSTLVKVSAAWNSTEII